MADNIDTTAVNSQLNDTAQTAAELARQLDYLRSTARQLGSAFGSIATGESGFSGFANAMKLTNQGLVQAISGLGALGQQAGAILGVLTKPFMIALPLVAQEAERTAKAFKELNQVGGLIGGSLSGLRDGFLASGMSLDAFKRTVIDNATTLARFKGSVAGGAEEFTKLTGSITEQDAARGDQLRKLGYDADAMGEATAAFVSQQTRLGRAQSMNTEQLAAASRNYMFELDALSRTTGKSREAIQKQQEAAQNEAKFRATTKLIEQQYGTETAESFRRMNIMFTNPALAQAFRDLASGTAGTADAQALLAATGGAAADIINRMKTAGLSEADAMRELQAAYRQMAPAYDFVTSQAGETGTALRGLYVGLEDLRTADLSKLGEGITREQKRQAETIDAVTNSFVTIQKDLELLNRSANALGTEGLPLFTKGVEAATEAFKFLTGVVGRLAGVDTSRIPLYRAEQQQRDVARAEWERQQREGTGSALPGTGPGGERPAPVYTPNPLRPRAVQGGMPDMISVLRNTAGGIGGTTAGRLSAVLSGPSTGYTPSLVIQGAEQLKISPLPTPAETTAAQDRSEMMSDQLDRLDELINLTKNSVVIQQKILQYSQ